MAVCVVIRNSAELGSLEAFGRRVARALEEPLELWLAFQEEERRAEGKAEGGGNEGTVTIKDLSGANRRRQVLDAIKETSPRLLLIAKQAGAKSDDPDVRFASDLFERVPCQILVVRLSEELAAPDSRILVPCAGGRHSRRALILAAALAEEEAVAFQLRPDTDDLSEELGHAHLKKVIRRVGLKTGEVATRVRLGDSFPEAIHEEMGGAGYSMLLIGASDSGTLRRKLFGTLPERLFQREEGITVGVIRAERTKGHRFREAVGRLVHLTIPQLNREERLTLFEEVESKSRWNFDFAALMMLATAIAGMGLLVNSGAVVIGAMLVAPLMMPLIGTGLSLVQGNWPLGRQALSAVGRGFCFALGLSVVMGFLARLLHLGLTDQLRMRGEPNALDLGIAFVSGIAASYCVARPKLSGALAGVAIAAALVPPIATVGIGLAMGQTDLAFGAALLFGTNIVAIVLGAGLNFLLAGVSGIHKAGAWGRRSLIALILICVGLTVPLTSALLSRLSRSEQLEEAIADTLPDGVALVSIDRMKGGGYHVAVESAAALEDGTAGRVAQAVASVEGRELQVKLEIRLVQRSKNE